MKKKRIYCKSDFQAKAQREDDEQSNHLFCERYFETVLLPQIYVPAMFIRFLKNNNNVLR